jgi:putative ABC transport system permease protein
MRQILGIAIRNTKRQKKRVVLLGGAIAFGFMIITILNGFTGGIANTLQSNFSDLFGGHIYIQGTEITESGRIVGKIDQEEELAEALKSIDEYILDVNKRSRAVSEVILGSKKIIQRIEGIDWEDETDFLKNLPIAEDTQYDIKEERVLILPEKAAVELGVEVGEEVLIRLSTITGQQNVADFRLVSTLEDQSGTGFSSGYVSIDYLNSLIGLSPGEYQILNIYLNEITNIDPASRKLYSALGRLAPVEERTNLETDSDSRGIRASRSGFQNILTGTAGSGSGENAGWEGTKYSITTLNDMMDQVMSMVQVLNSAALVVFIILLFITMVGIMNTFRMVMMERTREIGTMRALGMQRKGVRNSFLLEALIIALGGAAAGTAASMLMMGVVSVIPLTSIPALQFFLTDGTLNFKLGIGGFIVNFLLLSGMSLFAAYLPAKAASNVEPAAALRMNY